MRILVIEDEPRILDFLRQGLEAEGFVVDAAEDGASGLRRALTDAYELVVLDLLLPGLDGLEMLTALRRAGSNVPVLILSARSDLPTRLRGFGVGANDFLAKPFSFDELVARVRVHVRRAADGQDVSRIRVGPLVLDLTRRTARLQDRTVDLSDREFRLLYHLASHPGEIVSRERLLSEVWGYSFDPGSNVVDVCVRRLRKKLGSARAIETVRNAGYRVAAA
jgi:two-component system, OmpR family, copper resistance phosphate regulon response regulator CusR